MLGKLAIATGVSGFARRCIASDRRCGLWRPWRRGRRMAAALAAAMAAALAAATALAAEALAATVCTRAASAAEALAEQYAEREQHNNMAIWVYNH